MDSRPLSSRFPDHAALASAPTKSAERPSSPYSWNAERENAIGWDLVGIGTAGLTILRGAALLTPGLGQVVLAASVVQLVVTSQKLLLDLSLSDVDQSKVNAAWPVVEPGGRAAAVLSAILGADEKKMLGSAKYGQLAFDLAFGFRVFNDTRAVPDVAIPLMKGIESAIDSFEHFSAPINEPLKPNDTSSSPLDSPPDITSTINLSDIVDVTNDPTSSSEYFDDSEIDFDVDDSESQSDAPDEGNGTSDEYW